MPIVAPILFLSSTTKDLDAHRAAVQRALLGLNFLYRGMEHFGSRAEAPRDVMLDELFGCDLFLGIVAFRYGEIDRVTGMSYTQLEYQTARDEGIPTIMFLMDKDNPVVDGLREKHNDHRAKLDRFKAEIAKEHVHGTFSTPEDLAAKVTHSLERWAKPRRAEWDQRLHSPLDEFEDRHIRRLHAPNLVDVDDAVRCLRVSANKSAFEHLYALLYRPGLPKGTFDNVLDGLILSLDEQRVRQMLLNIARDLPERLSSTIEALGQRAQKGGRTTSIEEADCVRDHCADPDWQVRYEVAHAMGKILRKQQVRSAECRAALVNLRDNDPDERVKSKARDVLSQLPGGSL